MSCLCGTGLIDAPLASDRSSALGINDCSGSTTDPRSGDSVSFSGSGSAGWQGEANQVPNPHPNPYVDTDADFHPHADPYAHHAPGPWYLHMRSDRHADSRVNV